MPERPVDPRDCALAFALPLTEAELAADLEAPAKDFARSLRAPGSTRSAEDVWRLGYGQIAALGHAVLRDAELLGASVVTRATLADVRDLLARFHVVTVFAHAPFVGFTA